MSMKEYTTKELERKEEGSEKVCACVLVLWSGFPNRKMTREKQNTILNQSRIYDT
jgi:hypothetical protein